MIYVLKFQVSYVLICLKLFSQKYKKNSINLSSAKLVQRVVKIKYLLKQIFVRKKAEELKDKSLRCEVYIYQSWNFKSLVLMFVWTCIFLRNVLWFLLFLKVSRKTVFVEHCKKYRDFRFNKHAFFSFALSCLISQICCIYPKYWDSLNPYHTCLKNLNISIL